MENEVVGVTGCCLVLILNWRVVGVRREGVRERERARGMDRGRRALESGAGLYSEFIAVGFTVVGDSTLMLSESTTKKKALLLV